MNGANNQVIHGKILKHLKRFSPDIFSLQETHVRTEKLGHLKREWVGEVLGAGQSSKRAAVAVLSNKKLNLTVNNVLSDHFGRYILINISVESNNFTLVNVYAPIHEGCPGFFSTIESKLVNFCVNLTLNPKVDKSGKINQLKKSVFMLFKLMHARLVDIWRTQ